MSLQSLSKRLFHAILIKSCLFLVVLCSCTYELCAQLTEIGIDDFRISLMGPDGDPNFDGANTKVAYNSKNNQYLVVWSGDDDTDNLVEGEGEIFGSLLAADGSYIDTMFRISEMGPDGDAEFDASVPAVVYNVIDNEYLVVWSADDDTGALINNESEIYVIRLDSSGNKIGNQIRISDMGPDGNATFAAFSCEVAHNTTDNQYLVVWTGDDDSGVLVNNEFEIYGQLLNALGVEIGTNDFRISDDGVDGDHSTDAMDPDVAYNSIDNEYMVTWRGHLDPIPPLNNTCDEEIFGQRVSAAGAEVGTNDFRISKNFTDGNCQYDVADPSIAHNPDDNEYLVAWQGQDEEVDVGGFIFQLAKEVYGMILNPDGTRKFANDLRYSDVAGDDPQMAGNEFEAGEPIAIYNTVLDEYLIIFQAEDNIDGQVDREIEIFVQRVDKNGTELGINDQRITSVGPIGDLNFDASLPHGAFNSTSNEYLAVFRADDNTPPLVDEEIEIFGQLLNFGGEPTINNDCSQVTINVTDQLIDSSGDNIYRATQSITSDATLSAAFNNYIFQAPESIVLNIGYSIESGVSFEADASPCTPF